MRVPDFVCVLKYGKKKKSICITSGQPMLNIGKLFCISPLDFTSTSSSVFLSPLLECCWRVFKRLQGSAKLDRVRCNEKHARESYDIKCHTNTPRQTLQSFSHSICLPSSHACNPSCCWENKRNCEPFGGWEKLIFAFNGKNLLLIGAAHINT